MKKIIFAPLFAMAISFLAGCSSDADVASRNLSKAADMFQVNRRIVFYNSFDSSYMMTITGLCSLGNYDKNRELSVTCKVGEQRNAAGEIEGKFKKHFLGLSDNVTFIVEQLEPMPINTFHYKVIFKPSSIIPDVDLVN